MMISMTLMKIIDKCKSVFSINPDHNILQYKSRFS